jgi:hypothetical protein
MLVLLTGPVGAAAAALSTALFGLGGAAYLKKKQRAGLAHCQRRFFLSETINAKYFSGGFWHWGPLLVLTKPGDGRLAPDQLLVFYSLPKTTRGWL